jgi:hypothetical protein
MKHLRRVQALSGPGFVEEDTPFVWLTVANKKELLQLCAVLQTFEVSWTAYHDPDFKGYDPSAVACLLEEQQRFILSEWPLWRPEHEKRGIFRRRVKVRQ